MIGYLKRFVFVFALWGAAWLAGCGQSAGTDSVPDRSPTRVPIPTANVSSPTGSRVEIVSLAGAVAAFLDRAGETPLLEQSSEFTRMMVEQGAGCLDAMPASAELVETLSELTGYKLPLADLTVWESATRQFPEDDLIAAASAVLRDAEAALPIDWALRICLIPIPAAETPAVPAGDYTNVPLVTATRALNVFTPRGDIVIVACDGGVACLDDLPQELARAYAQAYWLHQQRQELYHLNLLERVVLEGVGYVFARDVMPDASFRWEAVVTGGEQRRANGWLQAWHDDPRALRGFENALLYGYANDDLFPPWGGVYVGVEIVQGYRSRHPDQPWDILAQLPVEAILSGSSYTFD